MKAKRLLFLVMAICLASGVKAQFFDGPDEMTKRSTGELKSHILKLVVQELQVKQCMNKVQDDLSLFKIAMTK